MDTVPKLWRKKYQRCNKSKPLILI